VEEVGPQVEEVGEEVEEEEAEVELEGRERVAVTENSKPTVHHIRLQIQPDLPTVQAVYRVNWQTSSLN
jgi:methionine-rich copper-binding protein CopC